MTSSGISTTDRELGDNAMPTAHSLPPSEAVSLSDLIADAGPLPTDAALECIQRVAERLRDDPTCRADSLAPSDIWIDDNGEIWLNRRPENDHALGNHSTPTRHVLEHLARLAAFLTTANGNHLRGDFSESGGLPPAIAILAERLIARDRPLGYDSYAALVADTARLREAQEEEPFALDDAIPPDGEFVSPKTDEAESYNHTAPAEIAHEASDTLEPVSGEASSPERDEPEPPEMTMATLDAATKSPRPETPPEEQIAEETEQAPMAPDPEPVVLGPPEANVAATGPAVAPGTPVEEGASGGASMWLLLAVLVLALLAGLLLAL